MRAKPRTFGPEDVEDVVVESTGHGEVLRPVGGVSGLSHCGLLIRLTVTNDAKEKHLEGIWRSARLARKEESSTHVQRAPVVTVYTINVLTRLFVLESNEVRIGRLSVTASIQ